MKSPRILLGVFLLSLAGHLAAENLPASSTVPAKKLSKNAVTKQKGLKTRALKKTGKKDGDLPAMDQSKEMKMDRSYLNLQQAEKDQNKKNSAVSQIMKTKHDKVKNSVNNVR